MANNGHGNRNNNKMYEEMNKLPLIMHEYRTAMMRTLKTKFMEQLEAARKDEAEYCRKNPGFTPLMVSATYNSVCELLDRCTSIFDVEALARYVFDDNEIPTYTDMKRRSGMIELAYPVKLKQ